MAERGVADVTMNVKPPSIVMTVRWGGSGPGLGAQGERLPSRGGLNPQRSPPCLTVPLLCSVPRGRFQVERLHQVQRRLAQPQVVQRRPQVDDVTLLTTRSGRDARSSASRRDRPSRTRRGRASARPARQPRQDTSGAGAPSTELRR
jgi:hypothetical protein